VATKGDERGIERHVQREREQNAGRNIEAERASERLFGSELRERV